MTKVNPMPEILGTFLNDADANALKADAVGYIKDISGADLSGNEINVVENTASTVHVALPYYAALENSNASAVSESDLDASGGAAAVTHAILDASYAVLEDTSDSLLGEGSTLSRAEKVATQRRLSAAMQANRDARAELPEVESGGK